MTLMDLRSKHLNAYLIRSEQHSEVCQNNRSKRDIVGKYISHRLRDIQNNSVYSYQEYAKAALRVYVCEPKFYVEWRQNKYKFFRFKPTDPVVQNILHTYIHI